MSTLDGVSLETIPAHALDPGDRAALLDLCTRAYDEDLAPVFATFVDPTHVLARVDGRIVSHAMWVTRWLQCGSGPLLRTAYVEMVATDPAHQGHGLASAVMQQVHAGIVDWDMGGLAPGRYGLYLRLGWQLWRGPRFIRTMGELLATPEEEVMVLWLPRTPPLDLDALISAELRAGELW